MIGEIKGGRYRSLSILPCPIQYIQYAPSFVYKNHGRVFHLGSGGQDSNHIRKTRGRASISFSSSVGGAGYASLPE